MAVIDGDVSVLLTDPAQQTKALELLERLRADPDGWRQCARLVMGGCLTDLQRDFLLLSVIEHYLVTGYCNATDEDRNLIQSLLAHCLQSLVASAAPVPAFMQNKLAHIVSCIFVVDFPDRWPQMLQEVFLQNLHQGARIVELYLRSLMAIDSQVADREIQRSKDELARNTRIKDNMRELCVNDIILTCQQILSSEDYRGKAHELCLNVLGAYIAWVDVKLCVNDDIMPVVIKRLTEDETVEPASDMICSLLAKGMSSGEKMQLISAIDSALTSSQVYNVDKDTDADRLACVAQIINTIGVELISTYNLVSKGGQVSQSTECLRLLTDKCSQLLSLLSNEDTCVSSAVIEFAHQFVVLLKPLQPLNQQQTAFVQQLLNVVLQQYRLPDDYKHETEGEDELDFLDYRRELKGIITNIGFLDSALLTCTICDYVDRVLPAWQQTTLNDIELALTLVYFFGEVVSSNQAALFKDPKEPKFVRIRDSIKLVVTSNVSAHGHAAVSLLFHEIVVRYDKLFAIESGLIGDVLGAFLDARGLHHGSKKVRSRAVYLFCRFVKLQKQVLSDFVEEILTQIADLLRLSAPVASSSAVQQPEPLITTDDQLFVYETTGTLIVAGNFTPDKKQSYMLSLVGCLNDYFKEGLRLHDGTQDDEHRQRLVEYLVNIMSFASRTTKAFSSQQSMAACNCAHIFIELMQTFVCSLTASRAGLLNGLRQYLHRMVVCLDADVLLPYMTPINQQFVQLVPDTKTLTDYVLLIQQISAKYKSSAVGVLKECLPPLYVRLWATIEAEAGHTQQQQADLSRKHELDDLQKAYVQMCGQLVICDSFDALFDNGDEFRERVLMSLPNLMMQTAEPMVHKGVFACWSRMLLHGRTHTQHVPWLNQCLYQHMLPALFSTTGQPWFDFGDAQCMQVLYEGAACLKNAYGLKGDELLGVLSERYLAAQPDAVKQQLFAAIKSNEPKQLQKYLKGFFTQTATTS